MVLETIKTVSKNLPFTLHMAGLKMQLHDFWFYFNYAVLFWLLAAMV